MSNVPLTGNAINSTINDLVVLPNSNNGVDTTLRAVYTGSGTASALKLSTTQVQCASITFNGTTIDVTSGTLTITPNSVFNGTVTFNSTVTGLTYPNPITLGSYIVTLGGAITTAGAFTTSGAYSLTLTTTNTTNITLPTTGTLSTLAGTEVLTNKTVNGATIDSSSITFSNGAKLATSGAYTTTVTASASTSVTLPAVNSNLTQYMFHAFLGTPQNISANTTTQIHFDTTVSDVQGVFDTTSHVFVVPVTGYYLLNAAVGLTTTTNNNVIQELSIHDATASTHLATVSGQRQSTSTPANLIGAGEPLLSITKILQLTAGHNIEVLFQHNDGGTAATNSSAAGCWFSGFKLASLS